MREVSDLVERLHDPYVTTTQAVERLAEAAAEIERLRGIAKRAETVANELEGDNERLHAKVEALRRANEGAEVALKSQRAVIDSLRADAERYRWLRQNWQALDAIVDAAREGK